MSSLKRGPLLKKIEAASVKSAADLQAFEIGDNVEVHQRILEGAKERIQIFAGTVIARRGDGTREMFTVRRIVQGEGVERTFPVHSPKIAKIAVKRSGVTRRAKLYFLRDRVGKATKLRERRRLIVAGDEDTAKKGTPKKNEGVEKK